MAISGQKTVTTAGTEVALGTQDVHCPIAVKAHAANTGLIFIGGDAGVVSSSTGFQLSAKEVIVFEYVGNLGSIMVDSAVNGEGVSWLALNA
jgi:hypothetical protein